MIKVEVIAIGHGTSFNTYDAEFSFTMNGNLDTLENDEIRARAIREAKNKTACNFVEIVSIKTEDIT